MAVVLAGAVGGGSAAAPSWLYPDDPLRVPVTVKAGIYPREDAWARWRVDWGILLAAAGMPVPVDVNSIRVTTADDPEQETEVPSMFQSTAEADGSGTGELVWPVRGAMEPLSRRTYWVYFAAQGSGPHIPPRHPPIVGRTATRTNLVRNAGFERANGNEPAVPDDWTAAKFYGGQGSIGLVTSPCHTGRHALRISRTKGVFGCEQKHISLKPNTLYRFGFWARAEAGAGDDSPLVRLLAPLYNTSGRRVAMPRAYFEISDWPQPDHWQHVQKRGLFPYRSDVVTPPDTAYCDVRVEAYAGGAGSVYVDDVEIVEVAPAELTPPVAVEPGAVELIPPRHGS